MSNNSGRIISVLFFLSGFASLTYQVTWQRVLTQTIGADSYSITLIVSIFMLGLGLGGLVGGKLVRRPGNWMLAYAIIEVALGFFGFYSVELIRQLSTWLAPTAPGVATEFVANFALLCVPTILMGMTLPLIVHFVRSQHSTGATLGKLYGVNVAGAALGTLISGFLLVGTIGLTNTCRVIAMTNFLIAGAAFVISRGATGEPVYDHYFQLRGRAWSSLLAVSFATGLVALGYEIVVFRVFTAYFGMVSYVFPLLLFSYLACMTLGTWAFGRVASRINTPTLGAVAVLGSIATTVLILLGPTAMLWFGINQERLELARHATPDIILQIVEIVLVSLVLMAPIGFISGLFPVLVEAYNRDPKSVGASTGTVYFTQTMGNFLGASLTGLILLPQFGTVNTLRLFGIVLTVIPIALSTIDQRTGRHGRLATALGAILSACIVASYPARFYSSIHDFYDAYRNGLTQSLAPAIIREDAIGATLAYRIPSGYWINVGRERTTPLIVRADAWEIWPIELVAPLVPDARRALIIGIGPGMHLPVLERLYPGIQIDVAELNPSLIALMQSEGEPSLRGSLSRSNVYLTDGRRFAMKNRTNRYDFIQIGLNNSSSSGAGNLYTREFADTLRRMLTPEGVLTMNGDAAAVKALLTVFSNLAIASPGADSTAAQVSQQMKAEGSGARVAHVIAWNNDDPTLFRNRLNLARNYPAVMPVNAAASVITGRPNWATGCILFRSDIATALAAVRAATDDLPVTEYFLTQQETIEGAPAGSDPRVWGTPSGCMPLSTLATVNPPGRQTNE